MPHFQGPSTAVKFLLVCWALVAQLALAQSVGDTALTLSAQEVTRLRAILDAPIDPNALNNKKIEAYKEKDGAAWRLGDLIKQEEILREWAQVDPGARWRLRDFLSGTPKRAEAYQIGHELIKEIKYPPAAVRIRATLAINYLDDSNLKQAGALIEEAEVIIRNE
ncbi:MAG: hypothetical protein RLZZ457_605, partial [Pseudomonadota bacterium]